MKIKISQNIRKKLETFGRTFKNTGQTTLDEIISISKEFILHITLFKIHYILSPKTLFVLAIKIGTKLIQIHAF